MSHVLYCQILEYLGLFLIVFNTLSLFSGQANVYHATNNDGDELAIKVYKTSILVFK